MYYMQPSFATEVERCQEGFEPVHFLRGGSFPDARTVVAVRYDRVFYHHPFCIRQNGLIPVGDASPIETVPHLSLFNPTAVF